jgi:hypothetical protein
LAGDDLRQRAPGVPRSLRRELFHSGRFKNYYEP